VTQRSIRADGLWLAPLHPVDVVNGLRGFLFDLQERRLVGVLGRQNPDRRPVALESSPVLDALQEVVDVRLLPLAHNRPCYRRALT